MYHNYNRKITCVINNTLILAKLHGLTCDSVSFEHTLELHPGRFFSSL